MASSDKPGPHVTRKPRHHVAVPETRHWIETLAGGARVLIRPLRPEDREAEARFIAALSPQARRFRFLGDFKAPGQALLDQLMDIDYPRSVAFVALASEGGHLREVGVGRYAADAGGRTCECAVTVAEDWHHRGLGAALVRRLIEVARENGMNRLFSLDDPANADMRELAASLGFRCEAAQDDPHLVVYTLDL